MLCIQVKSFLNSYTYSHVYVGILEEVAPSPHSMPSNWCSICALNKPLQTFKMPTASGWCGMVCDIMGESHHHSPTFAPAFLWSGLYGPMGVMQDPMLVGQELWKSSVNGAGKINPRLNVRLFLWEEITNLSKRKGSIVVNLSSMVGWSPQECCHIGSWRCFLFLTSWTFSNGS